MMPELMYWMEHNRERQVAADDTAEARHAEGGEGALRVDSDYANAAIEPEMELQASKKKAKEKKQMEGLGTRLVNLQLPLYGLAVRFLEKEVGNAQTAAEKDEKPTQRQAPPLAVVVGGGGGAGNTGIENKAAIFHFRGGGFHLVAEADMGECAVMNLALHPRERVLACGAENKCRLIKFSTDKLSLNREFQTDFFENKEESDQKAVSFTPDGKMLVTAGVDGAVRLWDWPLVEEAAVIQPSSPKEIASMHLSPDGQALAVVTGQAGDVCRIWQIPKKNENPRELQTLSPPGGDKALCFRDCKFSPDGDFLYTIQTKSRSNSYLTKWSTKHWKVVSTIMAHTRAAGACVSLNVSVDGSYVATGSGEGEVAIFRASDLKWIKKRRVHDFFVSKVAFSPDSSHVFSTSGDYTLAATTVENTRGMLSMYRKELFVMFAAIVALLAILLQLLR